MDLELPLGWDGAFADLFAPGRPPATGRGEVVAAHRGGDLVATGDGELLAQATGRLRHLAGPSVAGLPAVGDWVALRDGRIHGVLPRRGGDPPDPGSAAGEQVLAANVDLVLAVVAKAVTPTRAGWSGCSPWPGRAAPSRWSCRPGRPVPRLGHRRRHRAGRAGRGRPGRQVLALSCYTGEGVDEIAAMLDPGRHRGAARLLGVGKSTWSTAWPAGTCWPPARSGTTARAATRPPPAGRAGRRRPGHRHPGLRELGLWTGGSGTAAAFDDVETLAAGCRFDDCRHRTEPGCAVLQALEDGRLPAGPVRRLGEAQRELAWAERRADPLAAASRRRQIRALSRSIRANNLHRGRG